MKKIKSILVIKWSNFKEHSLFVKLRDLVVGRSDVVEEVPRGVELFDATTGQDEDLVAVQSLLDVVRDHQHRRRPEPEGF
jgi:hypothetical protein